MNAAADVYCSRTHNYTVSKKFAVPNFCNRLLTDSENVFTVGNTNELTTK